MPHAAIRKQLQEFYTKNHNVHFISENSLGNDTLSAEEIRFNTLIQSYLNKLYVILQSNREDKTHWAEFIGGAVGFALFVCTDDPKLKVAGIATAAASAAVAVKRENDHEKLQRSALSFLRVVDTKEKMDKWTLSLISNLGYRFQNLIKQLKNDESGVDKLTKFFSTQIIITILNNQSKFESSTEILDYVIRDSFPEINSTAYNSFINLFKLDFFKKKVVTKKNTEFTIESCLLHAAAVTESGSICIREGIENPFQYPIQRITSEHEAKRQGFIILLDIPTSWDIFIERVENSHENVKSFKKIQPENLLFIPTLLQDIFKRQRLAKIALERLQQADSVSESTINETLDTIGKYLEFLFLMKTNNHSQYSDCGLEKITGGIVDGGAETIQLIFFMLHASRLAGECEQRCLNLQVYKSEQKKSSSRITAKIDNIRTYRQRFDLALQNFYKAHKEYVNGQEGIINLSNKISTNSHVIDIPNGESLKARDMACIPPNKVQYFLNGFNPFHLNKNVDLLLKELGLTQYKTIINGGACVLAILTGGAAGYFLGVIYAAGVLILPVGINFLGELLEYKEKYKNYRINQENRADDETSKDVALIRSVNKLDDPNLENGVNNHKTKQVFQTILSEKIVQAEPAWKKNLEEARSFYAQGKAACYKNDCGDAIKFFQLSKDKYKDVLKEDVDAETKKKAEKRLAKFQNPNGKYSPLKLTK